MKISFDAYGANEELIWSYEGSGDDKEILAAALRQKRASRFTIYIVNSKGEQHGFWLFPGNQEIRKIF